METWPIQAQMALFYGDPSIGSDGSHPGAAWFEANVVEVPVPWLLHMDTIPVPHIAIHKKCAASLTRVLAAIWLGAGNSQAKIAELHYDRFSGSGNYRNKRGGTSLSCHAYWAAIDWDAPENQQHSQHHLFMHDSLLVTKFRDEGWVWGGDWSPGSIDAMHVQAARIHS